MTTRPPAQCKSCKHWVSPLDVGDGTGDTQTCAAFPDGIPDDIWWNRADHREPYPGDHDIRWQSDGREYPEWVLATSVTAAAGHDVTPGHDELHHYWTRGKGLKLWVDSPTPWTTLVGLLTEHVGPAKAKVFASAWFKEVFGYSAGSDLNRVAHGKPPRGDVVGPG